ncbi:MAG: hypothetical protein HY366_00570 [Candidatus Aenigmarchaeota archaeon]|nr:hypothetical protein [Candidatus Aenigmarchaeota archaeon]
MSTIVTVSRRAMEYVGKDRYLSIAYARVTVDTVPARQVSREGVDIVLMKPQNPGNVGAVARAMKNFGFARLVIVEPCDLTDARIQAKHAYDVVQNAHVLNDFDARKYDYVIGTTGIVGADRPCITPEELKGIVPRGRTALLFGNEGAGLSKRELDMCDALVHIPTARAYAVMNVSHAAAIVMYALAGAPERETAVREQRERLQTAFINILNDLKYSGDAAGAFVRMTNRAPPTKGEADVLLGAFKKISERMRGGQ